MINPQPHIDEQRYEALAAKAETGLITQAELDEAQALVDMTARKSIKLEPPVTDGERWADRVIMEKLQSGDLPQLGSGYSDKVRAAHAVTGIADRKMFIKDPKSSVKHWTSISRKDRKFWMDVNKRAAEHSVAEDSIFDLDLSPFTVDSDGYLIPLSERFQIEFPDIRYNPADDVLPPGFEGFGFDAPTTLPVEDHQARFRRGIFLNALVGDSVKVGSAIFIIERVFSPYEAMAKKLGAKRKMFNLQQESDMVNVREQKGSWETTKSMPVVLSDDFDSVSQTIQHLESEHNPRRKTLYHVTTADRINMILEQGLLPMQTSQWITAGSGERYGMGEVYAMESRKDAIRWAARMDWELNKKLGSGDVLIVTFTDSEPWEVDKSDPLSQAGNEKRWMKKMGHVKPENIEEITAVTQKIIRSMSLNPSEVESNPSYPNPVHALRDILEQIQAGKQPGLYDFGQVLRWLDIALTGRTMQNLNDYARSAELMLDQTRGEFYLSDGGYSRVWMDLDDGKAWVTDNSTAEVKRRWKALAEE